jgi:phospholipid/cholesterol/gamma-HCH transport system substrate-binding protein
VLIVAAGFLVFAMVNTGRASVGGYTLHASFDNVGGVSSGADVRISGLKVGSISGIAIDPKTYQADVAFTVQRDIKLSSDTSAAIATGGLLGSPFLSLSPGGDPKMLGDNGLITVTQSAINFEDLLGKFIFNVGNLADASQKQLERAKAAP